MTLLQEMEGKPRSRPRLLDLFCGAIAGGCAMGYHRAGFDVVGVDIVPQKRFPFPFVQGDALEYLAKHGKEFDAIHASPPCQRFSRLSQATGRQKEHPDLIAPVRAALGAFPFWVMENVVSAPLHNPVLLCGGSFGLRVVRHRMFESNILLLTAGCTHKKNGTLDGTYLPFRQSGKVAPGRTKPPPSTDSAYRAAMGCDWMTTQEAREAIPPAYAEYIGKQLLLAMKGGSPP